MFSYAFSYLTSAQNGGGLLLTAVSIAVLVSLVTLLFCMIEKESRDKRLKLFLHLTGSAVAISILSGVTGLLTGLSREPAVTAVVPVVLTLFGGVALAIISRKGTDRALATNAVVTFSLVFLVSVMFGSYWREATELDRGLAAVMREQRIELFRQNLDLPPAVSNPRAIGGE